MKVSFLYKFETFYILNSLSIGKKSTSVSKQKVTRCWTEKKKGEVVNKIRKYLFTTSLSLGKGRTQTRIEYKCTVVQLIQAKCVHH